MRLFLVMLSSVFLMLLYSFWFMLVWLRIGVCGMGLEYDSSCSLGDVVLRLLLFLVDMLRNCLGNWFFGMCGVVENVFVLVVMTLLWLMSVLWVVEWLENCVLKLMGLLLGVLFVLRLVVFSMDSGNSDLFVERWLVNVIVLFLRLVSFLMLLLGVVVMSEKYCEVL